MFEQGDIVIVRYPFSDNPDKVKLRPAVIVSNAESNRIDRDYLICPITSTLRDSPFSFRLSNKHTLESLPKKSEIRCNKIVTVRDHLIKDKFTKVKYEYLKDVIQKVKNSF